MRILLLSVLLLCSLPAQAMASRVLALAPHVCEMLAAIGASEAIVGVVDYCDYPEGLMRKPHVGDYQKINVEAALRLQPDVAVVLNRHVKGVAQLQQMGVRLVISDPRGFDGIFQDLLMLGSLTGHRRQAEAIVSQQQDRLRHIRQLASNHVRVFYELWPDPLMSVGGTSFINELISLAGGDNIFSDIPLESPHVNIEAVVRAKPQVIIIPLERRNIMARKAFWETWLGKEEEPQFVAIDPDLLHRPGPRLMDGLEQLQKAFQQAGRYTR